MSSLIAIKVETNMCLVTLNLFIIVTILCTTVRNLTTYATIITTITIRPLFLFASKLFANHTCTKFSPNYSIFCLQPFCKRTLIRQTFTISKHSTCLNTMLTELLSTALFSVLPFHSPARPVKRTFLKWQVLVLAFQKTLSQLHCYFYIPILIFLLMLTVAGLGVRYIYQRLLCTHCRSLMLCHSFLSHSYWCY